MTAGALVAALWRQTIRDGLQGDFSAYHWLFHEGACLWFANREAVWAELRAEAWPVSFPVWSDEYLADCGGCHGCD